MSVPKSLRNQGKLEALMEIAYRDNNREGRHISDDKMDKYKNRLKENYYDSHQKRKC